MGKAALDTAVAEAVTGAQASLGLTAPPEVVVPAKDTAQPPADPAPEAKPEPVATPPVKAEVDTPAPDPRGTAPTEYMGADLSKLPDDAARWTFIDAQKESEKKFGQLLRENAELKKQATEPAAPAAPAPAPATPAEPVVEQLSDEDIATALGINLEESSDPALAAITVRMARAFGDISAKLDALAESSTESSVRGTFDKDLAGIQTRFGALPEDIAGEDLYAWARSQGIQDAETAYWRAMGPVRAEAAKALSERLQSEKRDAKKDATTPRPTTTSDVAEPGLKSKNVKDAVKEAALGTMKELGIRFRDE
jgi:hypothetical protein